jgi:hypothetical protein
LPEKFKVEKGLKIIGFYEECDFNIKSFILNEITNYLFDIQNKVNGEKTFDLELDYKYYFHDFLKLGINLNTDDISWWEFDSLLESILLTENTAIGKVLQHRTYKTPPKNPKQYEQEERKFYNEMKIKYALKLPKKIMGGLEKMFNYVEMKAGEHKDE